MASTSRSNVLDMKLLPSGSYDLKIRRPVSDGVSGETSLFSLLNKTVNAERMENADRKGREGKKEKVMNVYINEQLDKLELYYAPVKCVSEPITQTG